MKDPIDRVVRAGDFDKPGGREETKLSPEIDDRRSKKSLPGHSLGEAQVLPRATGIPGVVNDPDPVLVIHGDLDVVGIRPRSYDEE